MPKAKQSAKKAAMKKRTIRKDPARPAKALGYKDTSVNEVKGSAFGSAFTGAALGTAAGGLFKRIFDNIVITKYKVIVKWLDGYTEEYKANDVQTISGTILLRFTPKKVKHIPLCQVREFTVEETIKESEKKDDNNTGD